MFNNKIVRFLLISYFGSGVLFQPAHSEESLGKLLTSPDVRSRIDNLRASKSQLGIDKKLTYRGTVLRDGHHWIWLNDQVLDVRSDASLSINRDKSLDIIINDIHYHLQPGQTVIPSQGIVMDPLNNSRIHKN